MTRRQLMGRASIAAAGLALQQCYPQAEGQAVHPVYRNPIMGGDHPGASPIRVGQDFYLTHSSFDYAPGLLIWRSRDLMNWHTVAAALRRYDGGVWAPYLCEYEGHFYIYYPSSNRISVVHADRPEGPWSAPISLDLDAIDPAHIAESGRRYLYTNGGQMVELTSDGLAVKSKPQTVFKPWPIPSTTRIECTCLEGPKLLQHNGYFYLNVAEGGTGGPALVTRSSALVVAMQQVPGSFHLTTRLCTRHLETIAG